MSEMVERVALAMWRKREESFPKFTRRMDPDGLDRSSGAWAVMLLQAQAAVEAMREPTEAMLRGGFVAMNETPGGTWKAMKAEGATPRRLFDVKMAPRWRAMIDAAMAAPKPTKTGIG